MKLPELVQACFRPNVVYIYKIIDLFMSCYSLPHFLSNRAA